jgi:hypothetical protein
MRKLLWNLARLDCLSATYWLAAGKGELAGRFVLRAGCLLESRARSRDPAEPWQPVLTVLGENDG